jgi:hypothetical protein
MITVQAVQSTKARRAHYSAIYSAEIYRYRTAPWSHIVMKQSASYTFVLETANNNCSSLENCVFGRQIATITKLKIKIMQNLFCGIKITTEMSLYLSLLRSERRSKERREISNFEWLTNSSIWTRLLTQNLKSLKTYLMPIRNHIQSSKF